MKSPIPSNISGLIPDHFKFLLEPNILEDDFLILFVLIPVDCLVYLSIDSLNLGSMSFKGLTPKKSEGSLGFEKHLLVLQ